MEEVLIQIAKIAPVVAVLVIALRYFLKKEKIYQKQIKDLNEEVRSIEKENLIMINKLADALDKISDTNENVHKELQLLKEIIKIKLDTYGKE